MKSITKQLENIKVLICPICNENPVRQGYKTCSSECSEIRGKRFKKSYSKTDRCKESQRKYYSKPDVKLHRKKLVGVYRNARTELKRRHKKEYDKILLKEIENEKTNKGTD